jgi:VanZ family protein
VIASSLYGFSDELHQAFVPMRESSWLDGMADMVGSILGAGVSSLVSQRSSMRLFAAPRN